MPVALGDAFNTAERWADDASEDIAREIMRRLDLAGDALPSSLEPFVETHLGPNRQLTLRLASSALRPLHRHSVEGCRVLPWEALGGAD